MRRPLLALLVVLVAIGVTILMLGATVGPARAEMSVYYHIGSWDAFSGPGTDGKMVCYVRGLSPARAGSGKLFDPDQDQLIVALPHGELDAVTGLGIDGIEERRTR